MSLEKIEEKIFAVLGEIVECQENDEPWGNLEKKLKSLKHLYLQQLKNDVEDERAEILKLAEETSDEKERQRKKEKLKWLFLFFAFNELAQNSSLRLYTKLLSNDAVADVSQPKI